MSFKVKKKYINNNEIETIIKDCTIEGKEDIWGRKIKINLCSLTKNSIFIPFSYYKNNIKYKIDKNKKYDNINENGLFLTKEYNFRTDGGRDQEIVFNDALIKLKKYNSILLSLFCGYGKTYTAIRLAVHLKKKTAILVHRKILFDQWIESIEKFTNCKVQIVETDGILDDDADFYIFNIAYVSKYWNSEKKLWLNKKIGKYKNIGTLIIDEAHIACAQEMSKSLTYFFPLNCIALTATPIRKDGLDKVLEIYFGNYKDTQIIRIAQNSFNVLKINTNIEPEFTINSNGKKDWNSVINDITKNNDRNIFIKNLVNKFKDFNILILSKRVEHCHFLSKLFDESSIENTVMTGTKNTYNKDCSVLISTYSKLGVGFDDSRLNLLILTCSVTEIEQYAGRLRDNKNKNRLNY